MDISTIQWQLCSYFLCSGYFRGHIPYERNYDEIYDQIFHFGCFNRLYSYFRWHFGCFIFEETSLEKNFNDLVIPWNDFRNVLSLRKKMVILAIYLTIALNFKNSDWIQTQNFKKFNGILGAGHIVYSFWAVQTWAAQSGRNYIPA